MLEYAVVRITGVIVYHIKNYNLSLAFMWSVPLNYLFYSNWWKLRVYEGLIEPEKGNNSSFLHQSLSS